MDIRKIKKLIVLLESSGLSEIEIKQGDLSLRLSRQGPLYAHAPNHPQQNGGGAVNAPSFPQATSGELSVTPTPEVHLGHVVRSPMVGTFYSATSPDAPPFVTIGQQVRTGEVLGIVEAMKMFNEIESDRAGKVIDILIKNGEPIEFDQPLFIIEE
ncbi:MAG: acetyl-CoA carboxylase biotin carboxyl carrier protein [Gammaproteobacteria bacterium]|nr:acetyl-CoA carboxylase biotin carboxyl carrier protein [Gammaproteobacteria bacterium]